MTRHTIITIGRQFGSGGHEVGNRLSEKLDIPLYDYNLIRMAAQKLKVSDEEAIRVDETVLSRFLSAYAVGIKDYTAFVNGDAYNVLLSEQMSVVQAEIIKKLAERSSCIFVGRCADYILGDYTNCLNIFVHAYKEDRIRRIMNIYKLTEREAWEKIKRVDKERRQYYESKTNREWDSKESYGMMFNTSLMGIEGVADALEAIYRVWEKK